MKKKTVSSLMTIIMFFGIAAQVAFPATAADGEQPEAILNTYASPETALQTTNFVCWAENETRAQIIAENTGGTLVSFENGITVLQIEMPRTYSAAEAETPPVY